jgi:hypothetical protein
MTEAPESECERRVFYFGARAIQWAGDLAISMNVAYNPVTKAKGDKMRTAVHKKKSNGARNGRGQPAWDIARLFPVQGEWTEEEYLALETLSSSSCYCSTDL